MFYVARFDPQGQGSCKWAGRSGPNGGLARLQGSPRRGLVWALPPAVVAANQRLPSPTLGTVYLSHRPRRHVSVYLVLVKASSYFPC